MSYVLDAEQASHTAGCPCRLCDQFRPSKRRRGPARRRQTDAETALEQRDRAEYAESELARYLDETPPEDFEAYEWRTEPFRAPVQRLGSRKDPWLTVRKWGRGF